MLVSIAFAYRFVFLLSLEEPEHYYNSETEIDLSEEHKRAKQAHTERIIAEEKHFMEHHKALLEKHRRNRNKYQDDPKKLINEKLFHASGGVRYDDFDDEEANTMALSEKEAKYAQQHSLEDKVNWSLERAQATREIVALERQALLKKGHKLHHGHDLIKEKFVPITVTTEKKTTTTRSGLATTTVYSALALVAVVIATIAF